MSRKILIILALGALAGLAGCSHTCVPPGWYQTHTVAPPKRPPDGKPIHHDSRYDIPGKVPGGMPTKDKSCLMTPPNAVTAAPAASAPAAGGKGGR